MKVIDANKIQITYTKPDGLIVTPTIQKMNHGMTLNEDVDVSLNSLPPHAFVSVKKRTISVPASSPVGPQMLPMIPIENQAPMLPMADIPDAFERQSKFTYAIAPDIDDAPAIIPGYIKTSCLMECVKKCGSSGNKTDDNFDLGDTPEYPLPLPMAPRETFNNFFLKRDFLNTINDPNINYKYNMDYTTDYEVSTTPFVETKVVPPSNLGNPIPTLPDEKIPSNPILAVSDPILPENANMMRSRADTPIIDMLATQSNSMGKSLMGYIQAIGTSLKDYMSAMSKNEQINAVFKDNSKIITLLIAIAIGSFILKSGVSALAVGVIILIAIRNVQGIF